MKIIEKASESSSHVALVSRKGGRAADSTQIAGGGDMGKTETGPHSRSVQKATD